jgi:hypothetical protein
MNILQSKIKAYRAERTRVRELDAEMESALIDTGLLTRASLEASKQRIANKQAQLVDDGLRTLARLPVGFMRPMPAIDPAYRAVPAELTEDAAVESLLEARELLGGRAGF